MTTRCMDSETQVMIAASAGDRIQCGCCGKLVTVDEVSLRPSDPTDPNTILTVPTHDMPHPA